MRTGILTADSTDNTDCVVRMGRVFVKFYRNFRARVYSVVTLREATKGTEEELMELCREHGVDMNFAEVVPVTASEFEHEKTERTED